MWRKMWLGVYVVDSSKEVDAWMDDFFQPIRAVVTGSKQPLLCSAWERGYVKCSLPVNMAAILVKYFLLLFNTKNAFETQPAFLSHRQIKMSIIMHYIIVDNQGLFEFGLTDWFDLIKLRYNQSQNTSLNSQRPIFKQFFHINARMFEQ